jgi:pilus assembly protein CpaD
MTNTKYIRSAVTALLFLSAAALTGCTREELELETEYVPNSGSRQYPIIVEKGPQTLNIANQGSLTGNQINVISSFARKAATGSATPVTISRPSGSNARLAHEVANLVAQQGVSARMIKVVSHKGPAGGPVKITYSKMHARTSPCGEWPEDVTETSLNHLAFNHGCAVQSNIAAMVVDPQDFETPTPVDPPTAAASTIAVNALDGTTISGSTSSSSGGSSPPAATP